MADQIAEFCGNCGTPNTGRNNFCQKCGKSLIKNTGTAPQSSASSIPQKMDTIDSIKDTIKGLNFKLNSETKIIKLVILICLFVLVVLFAFWANAFWVHNQPPPQASSSYYTPAVTPTAVSSTDGDQAATDKMSSMLTLILPTTEQIGESLSSSNYYQAGLNAVFLRDYIIDKNLPEMRQLANGATTKKASALEFVAMLEDLRSASDKIVQAVDKYNSGDYTEAAVLFESSRLDTNRASEHMKQSGDLQPTTIASDKTQSISGTTPKPQGASYTGYFTGGTNTGSIFSFKGDVSINSGTYNSVQVIIRYPDTMEYNYDAGPMGGSNPTKKPFYIYPDNRYTYEKPTYFIKLDENKYPMVCEADLKYYGGIGRHCVFVG